MRSDFFNEALISAMLVAAPQSEEVSAVAPEDDLMKADILKEHLIAIVEKANHQAVQAGYSEQYIEVADFVICAFIDEVLLSSPVWNDKTIWQKRTLQLMRHGTTTAGEDFYQILETLLDQAEDRNQKKASVVMMAPKDPFMANEEEKDDGLFASLEMCALCLSQGFTGKYYDNPKAIQEVLDRIGQYIPAVKDRNEFFVFEATKTQSDQTVQTQTKKFLHRFDILDWGLWITPVIITIGLYLVFNARLNTLLNLMAPGA